MYFLIPCEQLYVSLQSCASVTSSRFLKFTDIKGGDQMVTGLNGRSILGTLLIVAVWMLILQNNQRHCYIFCSWASSRLPTNNTGTPWATMPIDSPVSDDFLEACTTTHHLSCLYQTWENRLTDGLWDIGKIFPKYKVTHYGESVFLVTFWHLYWRHGLAELVPFSVVV